MAEIRRIASASLATLTPEPNHTISGLFAGETLKMGEFVYIKNSDGFLWRANGTDTDADAGHPIGVAAGAAVAGDACSVHRGVRYKWLTPATTYRGKLLYLSATNVGELADAAADTGAPPVAFGVDDQGRIQLIGTCA